MSYDFNTTSERSKLMKRIRSKNTTPERLLCKELWKRGIRYRKNYELLPGKPDIAITKHKIAIFIDGEFWHGYNWDEKKTKIKSNRDYWIPKIEKNIERDKKYNKELLNIGWKIIRLWEKEVIKDTDMCVNLVINLIARKN